MKTFLEKTALSRKNNSEYDNFKTPCIYFNHFFYFIYIVKCCMFFFYILFHFFFFRNLPLHSIPSRCSAFTLSILSTFSFYYYPPVFPFIFIIFLLFIKLSKDGAASRTRQTNFLQIRPG
jgi:hypothetical protein